MTKNNIWVLYSTYANRAEALSAATALLEGRLIACANVYDNITSVYRWQGDMQQEQEAAMIAKTSKDKVPAAIECIKGMHSYQLPCITAYPAGDGFPPFLQWVADETA